MYYDKLKARANAARAARESQREALAILDAIDIRQHIASVYHDLHEDIAAAAHTVYNLPGGRGSCKSSFVSLEIVEGVMKDPTGHSNAIIFRLFGNTLRESVFSQIAWAIDTLGVGHLWKSRLSPMQWTYTPTGAQILFRGLDDSSKLKSIKPQRGTFRFIWFEEFSELPGPNFVRSVMQSVQRGGDTFTVFRSFNPPISANNWANKFIQEPDARAVTLHTTYQDIPPEWLGDAFIYEAERLREVNPQAYEHEYMGTPTGTGGEVFPNLEIRTIPDEEAASLEYVYRGLDFGFAVDPAAFIVAAYDRKRETIFLLDEIYKRGLSNTQLAQEITERGHNKRGPGRYSTLYGTWYEGQTPLVIADAAEPKSIADMNGLGVRCTACHKEPGCVDYRVKWLQHRRIIIDPARTPNAYREFVGYEYATDKDGNFLSRLPDKDNHCIDSLAYALDRQIYSRKTPA